MNQKQFSLRATGEEVTAELFETYEEGLEEVEQLFQGYAEEPATAERVSSNNHNFKVYLGRKGHNTYYFAIPRG